MFKVAELIAKLRLDKREYEDGLDDAEGEFKGFGGRIGQLAATAGAGAAIAFGVALIGSLDDQDVGAKIAARLGGTAEDAKRFGHLAGQVYAQNFGESVSDVGDALSKVAAASKDLGLDGSDEQLQLITQHALTLRDVFGQDLTRSVAAAQQMIRNGLAPDAETAFDIITRGVQLGVDKSEDLLDTFNEYSTQFRELGLDAEQALGLMSQGLQAGARDSDTVADALKEFAIRAKDGSTLSRDSFAAIGLNADKMFQVFARGGPDAAFAMNDVIARLKAMRDPVAQDAAAVALFGTKAEDLQDALFALDVGTAAAEIDNLEGATQRAADTMATTASANIESFKRQVEIAFVHTLGGAVLPILTSVASFLSENFGPAFETTAKWVRQNQEWLAPLAVTLGTFAGIIAIVVGAMKLWAIVTAAYTAVQTGLNVALAANPIGLIVIAIAALVAGLIYAYKNSDKFRRIVDGAFRFIAATAKWLWHNVIKPIVDFFVAGWHMAGDAVEWLKGVFEKGADAIGARIDWLMGWLRKFRDTWSNIFSGIGAFVSGAFDNAKELAKKGLNGLISLVNGAIGFINKHLVGGINAIPGVNISAIPTLPHLARGGRVSPSSGGTPVVMGDGGEVEYGVPHSEMEAIIARAVAADGGPTTIEIVVMDEMRRVRKRARVQGGRTKSAGRLGPVLVGG